MNAAIFDKGSFCQDSRFMKCMASSESRTRHFSKCRLVAAAMLRSSQTSGGRNLAYMTERMIVRMLLVVAINAFSSFSD